MARILGVEIPNDKRIEYSLPYIYGIGYPLSKKILERSGIDPGVRAGKLNDEQIGRIITVIAELGIVIEGDLRREIQGHMKRILSIGCYRGYRHRRSLPVRGQRTRTNARTRKGGKKTVGIVRNKNAKKGKV
jgi:small subunit ribosomal protein S13